MALPFSTDQFFAVFTAYNVRVWPAQWALKVVGYAILVAAVSGRGWRARLSYLGLGALWIWMALAYHLAHFAVVNRAAYVFAAVFALAGLFFIWRGVRSAPPALQLSFSPRGIVGLAAILFGLVIYERLNPVFGHVYPTAPGFGLPCPTTFLTLGILSWAMPRPARMLLIVPTLWAFIGFTAAWFLGVPQDYGLIVAGGWGLYLIFGRGARPDAAIESG